MMMRRAAVECIRSTRKSKPCWFKTAPVASILNRDVCTNATSPLMNFTVTRSNPELVGPARPTPRELKQLSNVDDQEKLRCLMSIVQLYRYNPSMKGRDPVEVIRDALTHALVFYHPVAGRIVEADGRRLCVDCTGAGVWFVEADADVELAHLGDPPLPPFSWIDHMLPNALPSQTIINSPLFFIQVTRLKCGGFIVAFYANHIMWDASGLAQFLTAVGQIAQGARAPSIAPIWSRELFSSGPHPHHADKKLEQPTSSSSVLLNNHDMIRRTFFLGPSKLSTIRRLVPAHLRPYSTMFEILTACLWRCRTSALELDPKDITPLVCTVNARNKTNQVIPAGYYGNALVVAAIATTRKQLCESPIEYAIGLVKKAKEEGVKECMSWQTNPPVVKFPSSSLPLPQENFFCVSDIRRNGFSDVDFGWGKPSYGGVAKAQFDGQVIYSSFMDHNGDHGILVSLCLEAKVMGRFETEFNIMLSHD